MPILVKISTDKMEAVVEIEPRADSLHDVDAILRALTAAGVEHGIDKTAVTELADFIRKESPDSTVHKRVAMGTRAVGGTDGTVEMKVESDVNMVGMPDETGNIDFHERGSYTPITKDQLLAELVLPTPGTPGKTVLGDEIRAANGKKPQVIAGQGTKLTGTELRATRDGNCAVSTNGSR
jgi:uncharacterized protein (DUF342 family)